MPNVFAANGFSQYSGNGSTPTYELITMAIASGNGTLIFNGDPVVQATNSTGVGTGYITQAYGPVTLTVGATAIVSTTGSLVITYTGYSTPTANLPTFASQTWAPPVGSTIVITGATATSAVLNGVFTVTAASASLGTVTCAAPNIQSATSTASGTVTVYVPVAGIFNGCQYLSTATKRQEWSPYWPGSGSNGDVQAKVIADPNARFLVQTANSNTTATAVGLAQVGQNISFTWTDSVTSGETNGNTANGQSTMFADQYSLISSGTATAANAYLPFRIIGLANYIPGQASPLVSINGNDHSSGYNDIIVGFNNAMPRNFAGI